MTYAAPFEDQLTYVVGIGASAGGLDALKNLLSHLACDTQMAFVIIQHFPAGHQSMMDQILQPHTEMPVLEIQTSSKIKPNHVYLVPSDRQLKIDNGSLRLEALPPDRLIYPISALFTSLAQAYHERAIGVILSGTGTDGSEGLKAIKEQAGLSMVQDPDEAHFAGMPKAALDQNLADFTLGTEQLAQELGQLAGQAPWLKQDRAEKRITLNHSDQQVLKQILLELRKLTKIDFQPYRQQTLIRRLLKRMRILHITELSTYHQYLNAHPDEAWALGRDFLIHVTRFFRDAEVWEHLKNEVIPELCQERSANAPLRIWSAGCASGEEAYSLAMLIQDYLDSEQLDIPFKIFATDLSPEVIHFASKGRYPATTLENVSHDYRSRFFDQEADEYVIKKDLREHLVFARHNLLSDPPFLKQDLICCRNMLLYIQPESQRKILNTLHFALSLGGYLLLGSSETLGAQSHWFETAVLHLNLFQNKELSSHQSLGLNNSFHLNQTPEQGYAVQPSQTPVPHLQKESHFYEQSLLNEFVPPTLFVNKEGEVLYTQGNLHPYVIFPRGHIQYHLSALLEEQEYHLLKNGLLRVSQSKQPLEYQSVLLERQRKTYKANIQIKVLWNPETEQEIFLLSFISAQHQPEPLNQINSSDFLKEQFEAVKAELHLKTIQISQMREKLEASNEELQASNEELLAANEELQSTNEELQSVNEELYTVNTELENKIRSLAELNTDLDNFLSSTKIGFIFLDSHLMIRKFTASIHQALHLIDSDIGRSISHFSVHFDQHINLVDIARKVLDDHQSHEQELSLNHQEYLLRALPYLTKTGQVEGVVLTLVDLTELNWARRRAQLMGARYQTIVDHIPIYLTICNRQGQISYGNTHVQSHLSFTKESQVSDLFGGSAQVFTDCFEQASSHQDAVLIDTQMQANDKVTYFSHSISLLPQGETDPEAQYIILTRDITQTRRYQKEIEEQATKLQGLIDSSDDLIVAVDPDHNILVTNQAHQRFRQMLSTEYHQQKNMFQDRKQAPKIIQTMYDIMLPLWQRALKGENYEIEIELPIKGQQRQYLLQFNQLICEDGTYLGVSRTMRDITETRQAQVELQKTMAELQRSNTYLDNFVYTAAHDLRAPIANLMSLASRMQRQPEIQTHPLFAYLNRSIHSLEKILTGLIQVIDSQKGTENMVTEICLGALFSEIIENFSELAENTEHQLIYHLEATTICYIEPYMRSILQNLIDNAIKYRSPDRPLIIEVHSTATPDGIRLSFQDNGQGIPEKARAENLFQPFKRYHLHQSGAGIGLYLIQTLIEKNGGQVKALALQRQGIKFMLDFKAY